MNLQGSFGWLRTGAIRTFHALASHLPGGTFRAFGPESGQIGSIAVINLDRQSTRLRRTLRELKRFKTASGTSLASITTRLAAVDARDGREVASTADVDTAYSLGDQLYVQPDKRLEECFGFQQPVTMTRQEVAVARSHIEAWKAIASGDEEHVLIIEDDIWFKIGARSAIDRGWEAARSRFPDGESPDLLYLSYQDADGTADRRDTCRNLFRPVRGLWFLSGYVLSRRAARKLLMAMPVKGPVDMWINRRFHELHTLALSSPAIFQRSDGGSDNSYSVMPFLARAGVVDADAVAPPPRAAAGPIFVWCAEDAKESVAMALSMLGLRVRVFDAMDGVLDGADISNILSEFDALVDPTIQANILTELTNNTKFKFLFDRSGRYPSDLSCVTRNNVAAFSECWTGSSRWAVLCDLLDLTRPADPYPVGTPSEWRLFRDDRTNAIQSTQNGEGFPMLSDNSAWALTPSPGWPTASKSESSTQTEADTPSAYPTGHAADNFETLEETFPGNLATFDYQGVAHDREGTTLTLRTSPDVKASRLFRSGAVVSSTSHHHGHFEAEFRAASGDGLVTGFFLHRSSPRQEIDFEISGDDPTSVLLNVYFNPGDVGDSAAFGYRGTPCRIPLGFNASAGFHQYSIAWTPDKITWAVDGRIIHERGSWDPTPVPHLPMRLHFNLWAPRSRELAGRINPACLPARAAVKNIRIS